MAVRRAPATLCPISSPLSPSLTSLFWILFLLPFVFSLCFVISTLYLLCQRSSTPFRFPPSLFLSLRSLFVSFFFSRAPPRSTDISITTIFARRLFSNFRITILSTASNIPRVSLSTFPPSDFTLVNDSAKFLFGRRQGSARRFIGQTTRRTASYYRDRRAAKSSPATSDITLRPENCFSDHLRPPI